MDAVFETRHPPRRSGECNKTLQRSFKVQMEGENKQQRRSRTIITIPFPQERDREKGRAYREHTTKSDKSGALTAGTFERRNPVMQIRFSATILLLLPPRIAMGIFFGLAEVFTSAQFNVLRLLLAIVWNIYAVRKNSRYIFSYLDLY